MKQTEIKAVVGAGGKTTWIHQYARECVKKGKKVFVTTSTHMYIEEDTLLTDCADDIIGVLEKQHYVMAGLLDNKKIKPLSIDTYYKVCRHADVVLIEADGSRNMPVKFPASREPVIYDNVDEIVVIMGLHAMNRRLAETAQRPELVKKCLSISDNTRLNAVHIQMLIEKGYVKPLREKYPEKKVSIQPAHDQSLYQRAVASLMAAEADVSLITEEWFSPQPTLIILGGGHISCDLVKIASCLDFHIRVMDDREEFARPERFPLADEVICDSFDHLEQYLEPGAYYVVVTRGHKDDFVCVKTILSHEYQYVGMIGSRRKVQKTHEDLLGSGILQEKIETLHAPIGLDIQAVTPPEIAVSILAEIIAEKNSRQASSVSRELLDVREKGTLCIIIEKKGSSPRGEGSMMFVGENRILGSVGGGAVEFAAIEEAKKNTGVRVKEYHLNNKDSGNLGMVCGGSNKILFIPV